MSKIENRISRLEANQRKENDVIFVRWEGPDDEITSAKVSGTVILRNHDESLEAFEQRVGVEARKTGQMFCFLD